MSLYLDFQNTSEGHAEVSIIVLTEDSLEGLLEQRRVEGVSHHNVASNISNNYKAETMITIVKRFKSTPCTDAEIKADATYPVRLDKHFISRRPVWSRAQA